MQITSQIFYQHFLTGLQQNLQAELTDTDQMSSGKTISQPSDNPSGLWKVVDYQTQLSQNAQYQQAMNSAKSPVQSLDSSLSGLSTTLNRANELATSAGDGSNDASSRLMIADEVQQLFDSAVSTANTQIDGRYIFGGFQSNVNPINPTTGEFVSDSNSFNIGIANGINVAANLSAGSMFSFKRVNTTDSATAILPTYNWTNDGANTIPDADPVSALETSAGTPQAYNGTPDSYFPSGTSTSGASANYGAPLPSTFISSGDVFTTNGGSLNIKVGTTTTPSAGGFVINSSNDKITTSAGTFTLANGVYTGASLATALSAPATGLGINVTYDNGGHKFTIASNPATNVDWSVANNIGSILGFSSAGVQTIGQGITSDKAVGDVNLAAGSTLQDVRDALNTAVAGVKAQVVNVGSSAKPDFRLVIASDPAGSSANIDISLLSNPTSTGVADPSGTGINMLSFDQATGINMKLNTNITNYNSITQASANDSIVIDDGTNGCIANNQIIVNVGGTQETAKIARGTYTHDQLATAIGGALDAAVTAAGKADTYTVAYDPNADKFTIAGNAGNADLLTLNWSASGSTARQLLGFNAATNSNIAAGANSVQSDNSVVANYYSFNNNYLNDTNILRALNFEKVCLQNNDSGRVSQSLQYLGDLTDTVSQAQAVVGARENQITAEGNYITNTQTDIKSFMSNIQDTDIAKVSSDLAQRQTALQALRTLTAQVLNQTLFDFVKFS